MGSPLLVILVFILGVLALGLLTAFVLVPIFRLIGWAIEGVFRGIGWLVAHVFGFIGGMFGDAVRFAGALIAMVMFAGLAPLNVIVGRWSAAGHFADAFKRELAVAGLCLYRFSLQRPLQLLLLDGLLEGVEQRVPEAVRAAPAAERPARRTGQFDGYTIVGSLPGGGSGARLYVAEPNDEKRRRIRTMPDRVVIKAFAITEGSTLPQIVRESRALECARQLGHVVDHGMDEHRFFYVMPYHAGEHLGVITRDLHARTDGSGLDDRQVREVLGYMRDLLETLASYHRGGLWHKDVKPENVIVHDGRAHLVDLGLVTPLRSAMTLTTHGTEYFRDPELVRQALRGVKVHQIDCTRFDLYAVGAVLYFILENTFPAHGGLSGFRKASAEAVRWIVRRAMAEYSQRYESAEQMLADVETVLRAPDLVSLRPVDLPSMTGASAGSASASVGGAAAAGAAEATSAVEEVAAEFDPPRRAAAAAPAGPKRSPRPNLRVHNWWTGAYTVDDGAPERSAAAHHARRSAKEQLHSARRRAANLRRRAADRRRYRTVAHRPVTTVLVVLCLLFIGVFGAGVILLGSRAMDTIGGARAAAAPPAGDPALLLVVDRLDPSDPGVARRLDDVVREHEREGYDVVRTIGGTDAELRRIFQQWQTDRHGRADDLLEEALARENLYGLLHVYPHRGGDSLGTMVIHSERPNAANRRWHGEAVVGEGGEVASAVPGAMPTPPAAGRLLVINDHPLAHVSAVRSRVKALSASYAQHGREVVQDATIEAAVRRVLPASPVAASIADAIDDISPLFAGVLAEHKLAGVLLIDARPGDEAAHDRVRATLLHVDAAGANGDGRATDGAASPVEVRAIRVPVPALAPSSLTTPSAAPASAPAPRPADDAAAAQGSVADGAQPLAIGAALPERLGVQRRLAA